MRRIIGLLLIAALSVGNSVAPVPLPPAQQTAATETAPSPHRFGDGGTSAFYSSNPLPAVPPGTMVRTEKMDGLHLPSSAASGTRLLYMSTSGVGQPAPVLVSGQLLLPKTAMPKGGWPIIAWEHGTTGIADICAPSWRGYSGRDRAYLNRWLDEGFAIVATDYQGLGTPGPHPYLLYRAEGYSALDAVRAALQQFAGSLRNQIILVGQSQGSGAALGSAWLAPHYAPTLDILGVVATGLVVDFAAPAHAAHPPIPVHYDDPTNMDAAYAILRVEGTDQSLHDDRDVRDAETPAGAALSAVARTACLSDLFKAAGAQKISSRDLFRPDLSTFEAGESAASIIPDGALTIPVFAGTGLADTEASLPGQYNAVAAMCDAGARVTWHTYPGLTHNGTVNASLTDSLPFVRGLLSGQSTASTCAAIPIPGLPQPPTPGIPFND
ncbi:lipase family protein [Novosphingobium sp.]|uniref:lipase family protein n=1 Tax=Novosphingobium sp. TaxID=1874826 RepID=UPI003B525456